MPICILELAARSGEGACGERAAPTGGRDGCDGPVSIMVSVCGLREGEMEGREGEMDGVCSVWSCLSRVYVSGQGSDLGSRRGEKN